MTERSSSDYFEDILDAMRAAMQFCEGMDFEAFQADKKTTFAVIRALEVVGEASKKIPLRTRRKYPDIPWRQMAGMRDRLIHGYFGVDLAIVWETVTRFIPQTLPRLEAMRGGEAHNQQ